MSRLPSNLPELLRAAGLTVVEIEGWRTRERPASAGGFNPVGVLNHHTAVSAKGWTPAQELDFARKMALVGRPDLPPPLVQLSLGRSCTVYILAAGRANHAGTAKASGSVAGGDGNSLYVGIEWMLSGFETIPDDMMAAGILLNAVLTAQVTKTSVESISCHYQTSVTGKWDIGDPNGITFHDHKVLDVDKFRSAVKRERALMRKKPTRQVRAAVINIPIKVGPSAWASCWRKAARRSAIFGVNESFSKEQRNTYETLMSENEKIWQFGLHRSPNPIFWRTRRFAFVSGRIHKIHPAGSGALAKRFPGFNAARNITEAVLRQRSDKQEFAVLNLHWVPNGPKVSAPWRALMRARSKKMLRDLVRERQTAGRTVIVMGDTNIAKTFAMPKGFIWYRDKGIDKMGGTCPGDARTFDAPTDHKHGVVSTIVL